METRFQLKSVCKFYKSFAALEDLNLRVYEKTINAVMGPSGCGKSTLARVVLGLETPDAGEILYKGKTIESISKKEFREKNQVMFQDPFLSVNPCFKAREILAEPLIINKKWNRIEIKEKIAHLLEVLEIPGSFLERYPSELSGGQLQRIVLARALVLEPEFVVLDEPFSSLDEITAARLTRYFKNIFEKMALGVLYISHHLKRVQFLADHAVLMKKGKIVSTIFS
jgi:peptide/nickel transport system ATP-binding protein/oligopeptide transport system ATP-binding protein